MKHKHTTRGHETPGRGGRPVRRSMRLRMAAALLMVCALLAGCTTDAIPDLTEEEMVMVEEYAAALLLKYDKNYIATTVTQERIDEERLAMERRAEVQRQIAEEQAQRSSASSDDGASETGGDAGAASAPTPVYADIDEFLGLDGIQIEYAGYLVSDSYPTELSANDWQGVARAASGDALVVFTYLIRNESGADRELDLASRSVRYNFKIVSDEGSATKSAQTTLLLDDLSLYRETLPALGEDTAVLIIEVSEAAAASLSSVTMVLREGDARAELTLK